MRPAGIGRVAVRRMLRKFQAAASSRMSLVASLISLSAPPGSYGLEADRPYIAYNLLEEIDEPGEYVVDRTTGILYFWPPAPLTGAGLRWLAAASSSASLRRTLTM